ncbi:sensor histidine kinase [Planctomyces sp. SH-PL14]|uniref:sensor histidine kinase n=1 Tax=Planctomyces sp. SH-PL14 TaxID=1632864 RepID=UPI00078EEC47|nr:ATP-binding protein [Planctomyces sp. SH-PL14]AMV16701.1 Sensor protein ZraS [Planctomyces sp. SH-PL14]
MAKKKESPKRQCFLAIPYLPAFEELFDSLKKACRNQQFTPIDEEYFQRNPADSPIAEIASSDCIIADISSSDGGIFFQIGQSMAMGKPTLVLVRDDYSRQLPNELRSSPLYVYKSTAEGRADLVSLVHSWLRSVRTGAGRVRLPIPASLSTPFFVNWDILATEDIENLCRELIAQMGFRRIEWYRESAEFDLLAELPKKDPDGFEYLEQWLISLGRSMPPEQALEMIYGDPDRVLYQLRRGHDIDDRLRPGRREDSSLTLLLIVLKNEFIEDGLLQRHERHFLRSKRYPSTAVRVRVWDRDYMTRLVQQFPQLGFKYFSDEARSLAKFRKGPEELYRENVDLVERLAITNSALEREKSLRIRAERDAIWKDISFSAAHKIGNPIFAIETDLAPLQKRIEEHREAEAISVVVNMRGAVEKAKSIVDQFKSLARAQHISPIQTALLPLLEDACHSLRSRGVNCKIDCSPELLVFADPERIAEVLDELAANSLHWMAEVVRVIEIEASIVPAEQVPSFVDPKGAYVLIKFSDNGAGVEPHLKEQIFEAFFTTYDHGTGLGLALVRRIIEGHGGAIREVGLHGKGATFEIYLPYNKVDSGSQTRKPS